MLGASELDPCRGLFVTTMLLLLSNLSLLYEVFYARTYVQIVLPYARRYRRCFSVRNLDRRWRCPVRREVGTALVDTEPLGAFNGLETALPPYQGTRHFRSLLARAASRRAGRARHARHAAVAVPSRALVASSDRRCSPPSVSLNQISTTSVLPYFPTVCLDHGNLLLRTSPTLRLESLRART